MVENLLSLSAASLSACNSEDFIKNYGLAPSGEAANKWLFLLVYFCAFTEDTKRQKKNKKK